MIVHPGKGDCTYRRTAPGSKRTMLALHFFLLLFFLLLGLPVLTHESLEILLADLRHSLTGNIIIVPGFRRIGRGHCQLREEVVGFQYLAIEEVQLQSEVREAGRNLRHRIQFVDEMGVAVPEFLTKTSGQVGLAILG